MQACRHSEDENSLLKHGLRKTFAVLHILLRHVFNLFLFEMLKLGHCCIILLILLIPCIKRATLSLASAPATSNIPY